MRGRVPGTRILRGARGTCTEATVRIEAELVLLLRVLGDELPTSILAELVGVRTQVAAARLASLQDLGLVQSRTRTAMRLRGGPTLVWRAL